MSSDLIEVIKVKEVKEVFKIQEVNELLKQGWKLLGVLQWSKGSEASGYYVLGRIVEE